MSVEYSNKTLFTGRLSKVTNAIDGKTYNVSTVWDDRTKEFQTAILREGFFGMFRPLLCIGAQDMKQALWVHDRVEEISETCSSKGWTDAKSKLINSDEYAVASDAGFFHKLLQATGEE